MNNERRSQIKTLIKDIRALVENHFDPLMDRLHDVWEEDLLALDSMPSVFTDRGIEAEKSNDLLAEAVTLVANNDFEDLISKLEKSMTQGKPTPPPAEGA